MTRFTVCCVSQTRLDDNPFKFMVNKYVAETQAKEFAQKVADAFTSVEAVGLLTSEGIPVAQSASVLQMAGHGEWVYLSHAMREFCVLVYLRSFMGIFLCLAGTLSSIQSLHMSLKSFHLALSRLVDTRRHHTTPRIQIHEHT
jgi:hypothetical protein